jgi:hypothetical protein
MNPFGPSPRRTWLVMDALLRSDTSTALAEASLPNYPGYVHGHVLRAICFDQMGLDQLAHEEVDKIGAIDPGFMDHPADILGAVPIVPAHVVEHLVARLPRVTG